MGEELLFDLSRPGRMGASLPPCDVPQGNLPPERFLRRALRLPEVTEIDLVRYFTHLSQRNYAVDLGFYPLGSCTMKYNPKRHEDWAGLPGFTQIHPLQPEETVQGALRLMAELQDFLAEITGMQAVSLAPAAGAHGELTGMLVIRSYHQQTPEGQQRRQVLVPDSAHGTNPATAAMCGYEVVVLRSNTQGDMDLEDLRARMNERVAGLMLTLPNTLGLFDSQILEISEIVHRHGGLLYGDGANLNALLGQVRPGDLGFDVMHLNLHKTFSTPHGGGGPGAGPIAVKEQLWPFLPTPVVGCSDGRYRLVSPPQSIGRMGSFAGNFGVLVRAYAYIRTLGAQGLRAVSEHAVLNANYLLARLRQHYHLPYDRRCLHEVVLSGARQKARGVRTLDIAKRLLDYGFHPPTIYFPLLVEEAMMIEPTETESKETLDAFVEALVTIAREAEETPDLVHTAPHTLPIGRLDEATAARRPVLRWQPQESPSA